MKRKWFYDILLIGKKVQNGQKENVEWSQSIRESY